MFAIVGLIAFIIAALFKLVNAHTDVVEWLIIVGGIAYGIELVFFGFFGLKWRHAPRP
jgi:hypothetical protein